MRKSLLCDTFLTSSNSISEDGQLFNIDGNGNRVVAMIFGPKSVIFSLLFNRINI
jgi:mRNA-degrading endonuclease HigB of HigAB toxin-antitoxin module